MFAILSRYQTYLLSLMRIAAALVFLEHGTQKLFSFPSESPGSGTLGTELFLFTGILETVGGALVALGLFTRPAAFLLSGEMAVGYWWMHAPQSFFPVSNGGEAMVLYCFVFLYLAATGPGPLSLDAASKDA
jgi:putative oxidoreductase